MKITFFGLICLLCPGCLTRKNPYPDPPHVSAVPGPGMFDLTVWEYRCFPMPKLTLELWEDALNHYGKKGWELSGLINKNGNTIKYCLKRQK